MVQVKTVCDSSPPCIYSQNPCLLSASHSHMYTAAHPTPTSPLTNPPSLPPAYGRYRHSCSVLWSYPRSNRGQKSPVSHPLLPYIVTINHTIALYGHNPSQIALYSKNLGSVSGLYPAGGSTVRMPRQVPYARAMEVKFEAFSSSI